MAEGQEPWSIFASLELREAKPDITERHDLKWFIHDDVEFEIECKHEPYTEGKFICGGDAVMEDPAFFAESYAGERVPLRDGPIKIWWEGEGEDSELFWDYETEDNSSPEG